MQNLDGQWRVEAARRCGQRMRWYRIVRGNDDAVVDCGLEEDRALLGSEFESGQACL
ncbi:hypothetical protein Aca07nite_88600 [Actinoplanes capillaceus]|uniref:Uncharacterized protein n=2 Tax=Actinoplanes campanulatus TaxID=113559 RepID=A0ABQ3WZK6_9ACTN|nr:hypothetical protein Aca07nite_88600 [Actinoplanes capillaceus]